jgi:hypothetical protein
VRPAHDAVAIDEEERGHGDGGVRLARIFFEIDAEALVLLVVGGFDFLGDVKPLDAGQVARADPSELARSARAPRRATVRLLYLSERPGRPRGGPLP